MKTSIFRENTPVRTCKKEYKRYNSYKPYLRDDFNSRCGYCNSIDSLSTYSAIFQIDHFIPKKKFEDEYDVNDYSNLVYSCPSCNRYKSDTWVSESPFVNIIDNKGFVDPCDDMYSKLLCRDEFGKIIPTDELGKYIYEELRLYLKRHEIIYKLEKLENVIERFRLLFIERKMDESQKDLCMEMLFQLIDYSKYLNVRKS